MRRCVRTFDPRSVKEVSKCWDTGGMVEAGLFIWILLSPVHSLLLWRIREVGVEAPWPSALTKLAPKPTSDLTFPHHAITVLSWSWPLAPALSPFTPVDAKSRSRSVCPPLIERTQGPAPRGTFTHRFYSYSSKHSQWRPALKVKYQRHCQGFIWKSTLTIYTYISLTEHSNLHTSSRRPLSNPKAHVSAVTEYTRLSRQVNSDTRLLVGRPVLWTMAIH